jgi:hypothetical protein
VLALGGLQSLWADVAGYVAADFEMFLETARALQAGTVPYPANAVEGYALYNMNPPHFHLSILPWLALSPDLALLGHQLTNVVALVAAVWWLAPAHFWRSTRAQWVGIALLWWPALHLTLSSGQFTGWLALGVALCYHWRHTHPWRAGVLFGVLVSVKPFLGLVWLWWAVRGERTLVIGAVVGGLVAVAIGVAWVGVGPYLDWIAALRAVTWIGSPFSTSLIRLTDVYPIWLVAILQLAVLVQTLQYRGESWAHPLLASITLSPLGWPYYLVILVPFLVTARLPWLSACLLVPIQWTIATRWCHAMYIIGTLALWRQTAHVPTR